MEVGQCAGDEDVEEAVTTPALETMSVGPGATSAIAATQLTKNNINNAFKVTGNGSSEFMIQLKQTSTNSATLSYLASPNVMVKLRYISESTISGGIGDAFSDSENSIPKLKSDIVYADTAKRSQGRYNFYRCLGTTLC